MNIKEYKNLAPAVTGVRDAIENLRLARLRVAQVIAETLEQEGDITVTNREWYRNDPSDASVIENAPKVSFTDPDDGTRRDGVVLTLAYTEEGPMAVVRPFGTPNALSAESVTVPVYDIINTEELYDIF